MIIRGFRRACIATVLALISISRVIAIEIVPATDFVAERLVELKNLSAFAWDEHGAVWVLSENEDRLNLDRIPKPDEVQRIGTFERSGKEPASLLVHAGQILVSDGNSIRRFEIRDGTFLLERSPLIPSPGLFPKRAQITSLRWSPMGHASFLYRADEETGVGCIEIKRERWDVLAKGVSGDLAYDLTGFPVMSDDSGHLFRLALGLDYERGLHGFTKKDLAIPTDKASLKSGAIAIHSGANWPAEHRGTWLASDLGTSTLQQFREESGRLTHLRDLAHWGERVRAIHLQMGPDGAIWLHLNDAEGVGSIQRLRPSNPAVATKGLLDISSAETKAVVEFLKHSNSWQRDTALRVLDDRDELRQARGLHPDTPLHRLYHDTNATVLARIHALLALHRVELLDEVTVEDASDNPDPFLQCWGALLFGERNYPTGTAFKMLMKLSKSTNMNVRMTAAIAARQFVSGSLVVDTAPRAMPIREVYTGGLLSTLWFSTKGSSSPAFELLFWNALRPICAYDSSHPMGFFTEGFDESVPIAYWIIGLIGQQIAEQGDPLKQEDAMLMMARLKPEKPRLILAALRGLKEGTTSQRVAPTRKSLKALKDFTQNENHEISALAAEILKMWRISPQ